MNRKLFFIIIMSQFYSFMAFSYHSVINGVDTDNYIFPGRDRGDLWAQKSGYEDSILPLDLLNKSGLKSFSCDFNGGNSENDEYYGVYDLAGKEVLFSVDVTGIRTQGVQLNTNDQWRALNWKSQSLPTILVNNQECGTYHRGEFYITQRFDGRFTRATVDVGDGQPGYIVTQSADQKTSDKDKVAIVDECFGWLQGKKFQSSINDDPASFLDTNWEDQDRKHLREIFELVGAAKAVKWACQHPDYRKGVKASQISPSVILKNDSNN